MQVRIKNKKYDTTTAKEIGTYASGSMNDLNYCHETLYRKRSGEFFIHGEGGPRTIYATRRADATWSYGEAIRPVSIRDAKYWVASHCPLTLYEEVFGQVEM